MDGGNKLEKGGTAASQIAVVIIIRGKQANTYLPLNLNGQKTYALLDTGCETLVISRRLIPEVEPTLTDKTRKKQYTKQEQLHGR